MLLQHEIADAAASRADPGERLRDELIGMERHSLERWRPVLRCRAVHVNRRQPADGAAGTGEGGIGWNRGNASTRASHPRTAG